MKRYCLVLTLIITLLGSSGSWSTGEDVHLLPNVSRLQQWWTSLFADDEEEEGEESIQTNTIFFLFGLYLALNSDDSESLSHQ